jgi:glycine hydroxymethyltransferase
MAEALARRGFRIVSGGTDTHLMLVDVFSKKVTGKQAEKALGNAGITVNKNVIPFDTNPPMVASGIRIGTPAATTRGLREPQMELIAQWISDVLYNIEDESVQKRIRSEVEALTEKFPLYETRRAMAVRV